MLRRKRRARERQRIADEAAEWVMVLEDSDPASQQHAELERRFTEWARQSPLHLKEFMELHGAYCELNQIDIRDLVDVEALPALSVFSVSSEQNPSPLRNRSGCGHAGTSCGASLQRLRACSLALRTCGY